MGGGFGVQSLLSFFIPANVNVKGLEWIRRAWVERCVLTPSAYLCRDQISSNVLRPPTLSLLLIFKRKTSCKQSSICHYFIVCVCSWYNKFSVWLLCSDSRALFSHNACGLITGLQKRSKSLIMNKLLTLNIWSLWENFKPWICHIDPLLLSEYSKVSFGYFPVKTSFSIHKYLVLKM